MSDTVDELKDQSRECRTTRPDRPEVAEILLQSGMPEGFSMEWVFDRYDEICGHNRGRV